MGMALGMTKCDGILGNELMRNRLTGYFPRRKELILQTLVGARDPRDRVSLPLPLSPCPLAHVSPREFHSRSTCPLANSSPELVPPRQRAHLPACPLNLSDSPISWAWH